MIGFFTRWAAAAAVVAVLFAVPSAAMAQAQDGSGAQINIGGGRLTAAEAEDLALYDEAMGDFQARGFSGLEANLPKLRRALERAPEHYPVVEQSGDRWIVRAEDTADALMLSIMATAAANKASPGGQPRVDTQRNVYPLIALVLGSMEVERRNYQGGIDYLDRGLALQPMNWMLLSEKLSALHGLGRWEDALKAADDALASGDLLISTHADHFHRKRGFALIELGRLDEALAAYEESLKSDPDNPVARQEIDYIRGLQAGAPATEPEIFAPYAPQPEQTSPRT